MTKRFLVTIGLMGTLSMILGAIGAHILRGNIPDDHLEMFNTANQFLMYHTLALLALSFMSRFINRSYLNAIYYLFIVGIILFSGTFFLLSLREVIGFDISGLSKLAPIGGILLISGWIVIIFAGINYKHKKRHD